MRLLAISTLLMFSVSNSALAQSDEDPTSVPQLNFDNVVAGDETDTEQVARIEPLQVSDTQVDQVGQSTTDFGVMQADGGNDLCATESGEQSDVCNAEAEMLAHAQRPQRASLPEENFFAGSPTGIDLFSRDPRLTADQIGRGNAASLAAQSYGNELLNPPNEEKQPAESILPQDLPPDVLQIFDSGSPVPPEGY